MSDDAERKPIHPGASIDPVAMARRDLTRSLPRRFYTMVSVGGEAGAYGPCLDGRPVRTPAKAPLVVPTLALAEAIAAEWRAAIEIVDPAAMPLTKLANAAIDGVALHLTATIDEVARFADTDLVCYRASGPPTLVAAQAKLWDPVLAFARDTLDARFICSAGIVYVEQSEHARAQVRAAIDRIAEGPGGALRLAALHVMTTLTGSVLIALAVAMGEMDHPSAWTAAHVDEDFQTRSWGEDAEALARRELRWREMAAAAVLFAMAA